MNVVVVAAAVVAAADGLDFVVVCEAAHADSGVIDVETAVCDLVRSGYYCGSTY